MDRQLRTRGRQSKRQSIGGPMTLTRPSPGRTKESLGHTKGSPGRPPKSPRNVTGMSPRGNRGAKTRASEDVEKRRSSRPRSAALGMTAAKALKAPTPIKETFEELKLPTSHFPTTLTTNTSTSAPNKSFTTSSVHSSYSSTTQRTVEIRSNDNVDEEAIRKRLADHLRRSISKTFMSGTATERTHTPTTNTDAESRYSRSVSRSVYEDDKSSKATHSDLDDPESDEEEEPRYRNFNVTHIPPAVTTSSTCRKLPVPCEFGGWVGATLLLLTVPVLVFYLQWSCAGVKNACGFKSFNFAILSDITYVTQQIFKPEVVGAYLAFQLGVFALTALLPGRRVHLTRETYTFNSLAISLVVLSICGIGEYVGYPVANFIVKHYLRICIYSLLNAFTVSLWCYYWVDNVKYNMLRQPLFNEYAKSGIFVVDYALGRQLNPKWLGIIDFKQVFYRTSLVSTLIFASCFIYKTLQLTSESPARLSMDTLPDLLVFALKNINYEPATLFSAILLFVYVADAIVFEHHLASSFELQHEGFGCLLLLRYAATPFLLSSVAKYFHDHRVPITCVFSFYVAGALLLLGLGIKRYSCAYKYKYRLSPLNSLFANIETIHTYQSSRLLLSGLWGHLRNPNYLGDIIALLALGVPVFLHFVWPPVISLLLIVVLILHRAVRANKRNMSRYHSSWMRYCAHVPNYIIPKLY